MSTLNTYRTRYLPTYLGTYFGVLWTSYKVTKYRNYPEHLDAGPELTFHIDVDPDTGPKNLERTVGRYLPLPRVVTSTDTGTGTGSFWPNFFMVAFLHQTFTKMNIEQFYRYR